ncbi:MAG: mechanosensitive ion channel [Lachnospiraceae bacterium]|nr:mechanosensitive ion channel [Lachnospiraceae bacterium]
MRLLLTSATEVPDINEATSEVVEQVKNSNFKKAFGLIGKYLGKVWDMYKGDLGILAGKIVIAILVYFIGKKIVKLIKNVVEKAFRKSKLDSSVSQFLSKLISGILTIVLFVSIIGILDIPTTSLVALVGSAGLAIGLSLQGSLQNFAGGVLILILKPFKVHDYIIASGIEGRVTEIDIFYTHLRTPDNKKIVIPNGQLSNASVQNVPSVGERRLDLIIPVEYSEDIKKVRSVLNDLANKNERVKKNKGFDIFVDQLADSSINIGFRVWVQTADYWAVRWELLEEVIERFREENINIPYNKLDVNIHEMNGVNNTESNKEIDNKVKNTEDETEKEAE